MKITVDTKQRIQSGLTFCLEFYKVLMGSFLILFVPQQCDDHVCSAAENIQNETVCFVINVISCMMLIYLYVIELRRENWCITYLDIDPKKSNDNLDTEIEKYPKFKNEMRNINLKYNRSAVACICIQGVNIITSTIFIGLHWPGSVAFTPLVGYIILMLTKLYNTYFISKTSLVKERAFSGYLTISKTYNTIDEDHKVQEITQI
jgi:hypothetical protein